MTITGDMIIGAAASAGSGNGFRAVEAATGKEFGPVFHEAGTAEVAKACALADEAAIPFGTMDAGRRAEFLDAMAEAIGAIGDELLDCAVAETGLPRGRIEGERARTMGQLRLFAGVLREGSWVGARIDHAMPDRKPLPRPDLRLRHIGVGPVAVFGASNFPLAFSVAGGDTASALAAGCPVVVKGHPAHPGTSELVGRAVQAAARRCGMPEGVFSLLAGKSNELGGALVADPRIRAVGFTGSRAGGMALVAIAAKRPEPIPVYAEMSSVNPVFLFPGALAARPEAIARGFVASLILGAGQFCTNPGLVFAIPGKGWDAFAAAATTALAEAPAQTMLTPAIQAAYARGVARMAERDVELLGRGQEAAGQQGQAGLFATDSARFRADPGMQDEIFGAAGLLIRCVDIADMTAMAERMEGQLTATLQIDGPDHAEAKAMLPVLERRVGRILVNGFPTGVEVGHAMVHGGPFPATSDSRTTSVGSLAIARFLRPVCYQDMPDALLPEALRDANPLGIPRMLEGKFA